GGYGWVIVAVSFLVLAFSSGLFQSFGVFAEAYLHREDAFPSASSGQVAFIGIAQVAIFCILSPITGYVCERVGFRPVMVLGGLMIGAGLILASFASAAGSLWMVTLGQGVITGIGAAATVNPARTLPSLWFTKKRGLATGIALCGGALGGVALSQIAEKIISSIGHRWALRAIGIICTFVVSSSSMLAYTPQQLGKVPIRIFDFSLFRSRTFAGFVVYGTILYIAVYIPFQFLPSFAVRIGHLTPHFAANLESFANIGAIVGKIGGGYMADSIGVFNTNLLMSIISAISFFAVWLPFATAASTVAFSIVYGLASGAQLALLVVMLAKIYGTDRLPSISGLILFFGGIALLPSAPVAGVLVDKVGH
ncbi:MFS general substrate transporter, partial [Ramicandelaber brevisporus]